MRCQAFSVPMDRQQFDDRNPNNARSSQKKYPLEAVHAASKGYFDTSNRAKRALGDVYLKSNSTGQ